MKLNKFASRAQSYKCLLTMNIIIARETQFGYSRIRIIEVRITEDPLYTECSHDFKNQQGKEDTTAAPEILIQN